MLHMRIFIWIFPEHRHLRGQWEERNSIPDEYFWQGLWASEPSFPKFLLQPFGTPSFLPTFSVFVIFPITCSSQACDDTTLVFISCHNSGSLIFKQSMPPASLCSSQILSPSSCFQNTSQQADLSLDWAVLVSMGRITPWSGALGLKTFRTATKMITLALAVASHIHKSWFFKLTGKSIQWILYSNKTVPYL